jgi:hypothetical protein
VVRDGLTPKTRSKLWPIFVGCSAQRSRAEPDYYINLSSENYIEDEDDDLVRWIVNDTARIALNHLFDATYDL